MYMNDGYSRELAVVTKAVQAAAAVYSSAVRGPVEVKENEVGSYDIVTPADVQAQGLMVRYLTASFPEDCFIAEEGQENSLTAARTWIIDPIDGTLNYQRGLPLYGTQVVLMVDKEPVVAVIGLPVLGELYTAVKGQGARLNGRPLSAVPSRDLKECVLSAGDFSRKKADWRQQYLEQLGAMRDEVARVRMLGAACCDFAFFAAGRTDLHIRFINKLWDFMPGLFLAREAGAYVDEDLLRDYRFLLLTHSAEEARQFRDRVLSKASLRA